MNFVHRVAAATLALVFAAGCSSAGTTQQSTTTKTVSDRNNDTTVTLHVGERLRVRLASTYWTIHTASAPTVLRSDGQPVTTPQPNGCVPGAGCGTQTATFTALKHGTATVTASRTTCGEALQCTRTNGFYTISVDGN
jgi:uncharacterized lipoprotein